jgi:hypothetical protein
MATHASIRFFLVVGSTAAIALSTGCSPRHAADPASPDVVASDQWTPLTSQIIGNAPFIEAKVGDSVGWFLLDTGSAGVFFDPAWAKKNHLDIYSTPPGKNELAGHDIVRSATIEVAGAVLKVKDAFCYDFSVPSQGTGLTIAGMLGYDFIAQRPLRIRYPDGAVDLGAPDALTTPPGSAIVPLTISKLPYALVTAHQGDGRAVGLIAMVDTGLTGFASFSTRGSTRLSLKTASDESHQAWTVYGMHTSRRANEVSVTVGSLNFDHVPADIEDIAEGVDLILGAGILSQHVLYLDYPHSLMSLVPQDPPDPKKPNLGLWLESSVKGDGPIRISQVDPGSLSERAGVLAGDILLAVNGKDVSSGASRLVQDALRHAVKVEKRLVLTVKRSDKTLDIPVRPSDSDRSGRSNTGDAG